MKKLLAILLCMSMILPFGACSSSDKNKSDNGPITLTDENVADYFELETSCSAEFVGGALSSNRILTIYEVKIRPIAGYTPDNVSLYVRLYDCKSDFPDIFQGNEYNADNFGYNYIEEPHDYKDGYYTKNGKNYPQICYKEIEFDSEETVEITFVLNPYLGYHEAEEKGLRSTGYKDDFLIDLTDAEGVMIKKYWGLS